MFFLPLSNLSPSERDTQASRCPTVEHMKKNGTRSSLPKNRFIFLALHFLVGCLLYFSQQKQTFFFYLGKNKTFLLFLFLPSVRDTMINILRFFFGDNRNNNNNNKTDRIAIRRNKHFPSRPRPFSLWRENQAETLLRKQAFYRERERRKKERALREGGGGGEEEGHGYAKQLQAPLPRLGIHRVVLQAAARTAAAAAAAAHKNTFLGLMQYRRPSLSLSLLFLLRSLLSMHAIPFHSIPFHPNRHSARAKAAKWKFPHSVYVVYVRYVCTCGGGSNSSSSLLRAFFHLSLSFFLSFSLSPSIHPQERRRSLL